MIANTASAVLGGLMLAAAFAGGLDRYVPSLKTRQATVIENPDELGYFEVEAIKMPDTADELIELIGYGVKDPA